MTDISKLDLNLLVTLDTLLAGKPLRHDFDIARREPALARHMSVTGG